MLADRRTPWITTKADGENAIFECSRCQSTYTLCVPLSLDTLSRTANDFLKTHRRCEEAPAHA